MKPLIVKKADKVKGVYPYCKKCRRIIANGRCGLDKTKLLNCQFTNKHEFKAYVTIPSTNGEQRKTRLLGTRDLKEAISKKMEFEEELKKSNYQNKNIASQQSIKPEKLIECMAMYIGFLNNIGVSEHKYKERSKKHIKDVERFFKYCCIALKRGKVKWQMVL